MSYANPTPLQIGMTGVLGGQRYRVAGRVVMGMDEGGDTYYWNEFNLVDDAGNSTTVVFEEIETGPQWRAFSLYEPDTPLTAREAASKRVGDIVRLGGGPIRITLVDQSRVYYIEGEAPEGVEVGDVANYFNAEDESRMLVASWTGDEVEFYQGIDLPADSVTAAFNLPRTPPPSSLSSLAGTGAAQSFSGCIGTLAFAGVVVGIAVSIYIYSSALSQRRSTAPVKPKTPPAALAVGAPLTLARKDYNVAGHAVVEVAKVGAIHDQHEYHLTGPAGDRALLICGLDGDFKQWHLFTSVAAATPLTPYEAAAKRAGNSVNIDGSAAQIKQLFRLRVPSRDGTLPPGVVASAERFGFMAEGAGEWLMARWNDKGIECHRGRPLTAKEASSAFGQNRQASK